MKKTLLFVAAAFTALAANAQVIDYDFCTNPAFFAEKSEGAEYDLIDKYGMDVNTSGTMFKEEVEPGVWVAVPNYAIDLEDGQTYNLTEGGDMDVLDYSHAFIGWDEEGTGPARVHYFNGWNAGDSYEDKNYGAASEADFIASKGALGFLRSGNGGSRTGTYVQFPVVTNPTKVTVWMGNQGGDYHEMGLYCEITPVVNGEALEAIPVQGPDNYVEKRYYKVETVLPSTLTGEVALRVGCAGSQVQLYHVRIESGAAGVESILDDAINADAPVYNLFGVKVDSSYKGIVIKDGKKYIQK